MCPNQEVERSLLPECHIANRVFMYSMLDYLHSGDRRTEDVDAELRDRYDVFCQVIHNFPMPLHSEPEGDALDYECVFNELQRRQEQVWQHQTTAAHPSILTSQDIHKSSSSSTLSQSGDSYENAVRSAKAQLGGGMVMDVETDMDSSDDVS